MLGCNTTKEAAPAVRGTEDPGGYWSAGQPPWPASRSSVPNTGVPPLGPMSRHVGPMLSPDMLSTVAQKQADGDADQADIVAVRSYGRVFPVPALMGVTVNTVTVADLGPALADLLTTTLGEVWPPVLAFGPLEKYWLLHQFYPAPPDWATGQPMELEICGEIQVQGWTSPWDRRPREEWFDLPGFMAAGPVTATVKSAHWSNYHLAAIGAPWYM